MWSEQHIGRRQPGQTCEGTFAVSVGRTTSGTIDKALGAWRALVDGRDELSGIGITEVPQVSATDKWRYWRCGLADGSRVVVNFSAKSPSKAVMSIQHEKLESAEDKEHWRSYWKELAGRL